MNIFTKAAFPVYCKLNNEAAAEQSAYFYGIKQASLAHALYRCLVITLK